MRGAEPVPAGLAQLARLEAAMARALALAARPGGRPSPNPNVGAVALEPSTGRILAEGWHREPGGPHAERALLDDAARRGIELSGATLVLPLEPCAHHGRTPPCAPAIAEAGFARVAYALRDPNPLVDGRGAAFLVERGIALVQGVAEREARRLLEGFLAWIRRGRPFLHLKMAILPDGTVYRGAGLASEISGEASRRLVHWWRHLSPALAVGTGTLHADDPRLTSRELSAGVEAEPWQPRRVVFASSFAVRPGSRAFEPSPEGPPPLVIGSVDAPAGAEDALARRGVETARVAARGARLDLASALELLGEKGVTSLLVEAGPTLADALLAEGLVDRLSVFVAGDRAGAVSSARTGGGAVRWTPPGGIPFSGRGLAELERTAVGDDLLLTGLVEHPDPAGA